MVETASSVNPAWAAESLGRPVDRLKRRGDFLRVAGYGRKWVTPGFILQAAPRPRTGQDGERGERSPARVGFTVSRKVGKAVVRNRARRRLRAAADLVFPQAAYPGWDFVLIGRRETNDRLFAALVRDLSTALDRLDPSRPTTGGGGRKGGGRPSGKAKGKGRGKGNRSATPGGVGGGGVGGGGAGHPSSPDPSAGGPGA